MSGAIQDYDRGLIIGRRSFGKGLVQKPFTLTDGSAIRLTVARYHTPSGRCIQRPYDEGKEAYYEEFSRRFENGEYSNVDSISFPDSLQFKTLNSGRTVYGGGGIMPDVFVPIDTTMSSEYFGIVNRKGLINEFILDYMEDNRTILKEKYIDVASFKTSFNVEDEILSDFIEFAEKNEIEKNEEQIKKSKLLITIRLKALIARNLWDTSAFFQITNELNDSYLEAIEQINSNKFKKEKLIYK